MHTNTVNGLRYRITNPNDVIQRKIVKGTQWNRKALDYIMDLQGKHSLKHLVNIGSHIGTLALPLSRVYERVTCYEPFPPTHQHLLVNIQLNNITNIDVHRTALGDHDDTVYFLDPTRIPNNSGGIHSVTRDDIAQGRKSSHLHTTQWHSPMQRLDDQNLAPFDTLLIDAEGTEYEVIQGAKHSIHKYKPIIFTEIWSDAKREQERLGTTQQAVIDLICSMGYTHKQFKKDDHVFLPN